jgi:hypothetical protein
VKVPIACSLTVHDATDRVAEWRAFLGTFVDESTREPQGLRLRLQPGDEALLAAVDLSAREKECCAFFSFTIDIEPDARWLRVEVPEDADAVLADFAALLDS